MQHDNPAVINRSTATHYVWGGSCDGWRLVNGADLSVIEERMPPASREQRHYHTRARQFFYVLSGTLTMEREGDMLTIPAGHGLEIPPGVLHQACNEGATDVVFLVISAPTTAGDRTETP